MTVTAHEGKALSIVMIILNHFVTLLGLISENYNVNW